MFNAEKRKETRMKAVETLDSRKYNLTIGGALLYGLLANVLLVLFARDFFLAMNPMVLIIGYFVLAMAGILMVNISRNPIVSFVGYNMICVPIGALLSIVVPTYPMESIIAAILGTALVTGSMMILSMVFKDFFSRLGPVLFWSLLIGIVVEFITSLFGYGGDLFNWLFVVVFSLYIGYDWWKAQQYPKTLDNAIDSAVDLYLDIINLFLRLLEILGKKK